MKRVLIIGAGRSATVCIEYLANKAAQQQISLTLADGNADLVAQKASKFPHIQQAVMHLENKEAVNTLVAAHDIVISLLPAHLHIEIAPFCVANNAHLLTASYVSAAMQALHNEAQAKGLIFLNECGLDPGIDHLSAMEIIDNIHADGYTINSFKSFAGGLVAPESDNNPWGYKFSWNPRNVVIAGQSTATFLEEGRMKFVPYQQLFQREEVATVHGYGQFDAYPNRDSLGYQKIYGLHKVHTMVRGTLRKHGYCEAWHALVMLGLTDDSHIVHLPIGTTFQDWVQMYLPHSETARLGIELLLPGISLHAIDKLDWLGMFSNEILPITEGTPAQILQALLEDKWKLETGDRDMIIMQHQFVYSKGGKSKQLISELVVEGDNETHTAMAKTVGLPLAMACMLIVEGKIATKGVQIPVTKNWYQPLLAALKQEGIVFNHQTQ